jgi:hypothetical protein
VTLLSGVSNVGAAYLRELSGNNTPNPLPPVVGATWTLAGAASPLDGKAVAVGEGSGVGVAGAVAVGATVGEAAIVGVAATVAVAVGCGTRVGR